MTLRSFLAMVAGIPVVFFIKPFRSGVSWLGIRKSFFPGLFLALTLVFQSYGLETTTTTNSAFITALYVIFVPLFGALFTKKFPIRSLIWAIIAIAGVGFLTGTSQVKMNTGDWLTLGCSIAAAIQILVISKIYENPECHSLSGFTFNWWQTIWAGVICLVFAYFRNEKIPFILFNLNFKIVLSLIFIGVFSALCAFGIQVWAQRILGPNTSSIYYLLEAPFAAVFAYIIFNERFIPMQGFGILIILLACFGSVYFATDPK